MLTQKDQRTIRSRLDNIYKIILSKKDIDYFENEIFQTIKNFNKENPKKKKNISEKTTLVICYGDSVYSEKKKSIRVFQGFFKKKLKNYFNTIHFLPFYPSSSDSGFAVKDHYKVENKLGNWLDIKNVSKSSDVMADMVINHSSARGLWFKNFLKKKEPGKDYFLTVNNKFNTSKVVRPRDHKLLKKIKIFKKSDYLWRTFSPDQIDLNFRNPSVLIQFIKIMIHLINNGVTIFRLDAIAYLWKENGSKCINLKQTHEIIKLLRNIINLLNVKTTIITETNLPEKENLSYFGKNDEANWIYNFSLPPLLIHAFLFENSSYLNKWSKNLPNTKNENCYLNFIASHDGIGMRPTEGLLNEKTLNNFLKRLKKNGSKFSYRKVQNKVKKVYEANITVFDALKKSDYDQKGEFYLERYISAHAIMISFEGIPAIYFNSIFGTSNDETKFVITGNNRDVNRYRWNFKNIINKLKNNKTKESIFYKNICYLLNIRRKQKAFHPNAKRINMNFGSKVFGFKRISRDKKQTITCVTNLSSVAQKIKIKRNNQKIRNLMGSKILIKNNQFVFLKPFETLWISNI
ncbi:alpha-amylase family glycosyl hydrolase [Candidatus Pelagibacter sp.]|nr:alpha-amylase family glycosyl hydrolase [Candidatus Pelagibacter sp.]